MWDVPNPISFPFPFQVYLKAHADHEEEPVTQLRSEVRHIQEAGSALQKLREDLSTKLQTQTEFLEFWDFREFQESSEEDPKALRLLWRLQEAEKWHQLERSSLENLEMHDQIEHLIEKQVRAGAGAAPARAPSQNTSAANASHARSHCP